MPSAADRPSAATGPGSGAVDVQRAQVRVEGCTPDRAERISRLVFYHLQQMFARGGLVPGTPRAVTHLQVPSLEVDFGLMDDDTIARTGALQIYRSLWPGL
jgi:hypothetical protein